MTRNAQRFGAPDVEALAAARTAHDAMAVQRLAQEALYGAS
jgi:hypothetical protein